MADESLPASGVYAIRNLISGRVYVGSATSIKNRWAVHRHGLSRRTHHSRTLQRAWDKYGEAAFEFSVLEAAPRATLLEREQHWIDHFDSCRSGYNSVPTAFSTLGMRHTEDAKRRMSAAHKERLKDPAVRAARAALVKAAQSTDDFRRGRSERAKAQWKDPAFREAATERCRAQLSSPEWRADHSAKIKAVWSDPERRAAMCASMKGGPGFKPQVVTLFGVEFPSIAAAARAHGRNPDWVRVRVLGSCWKRGRRNG